MKVGNTVGRIKLDNPFGRIKLNLGSFLQIDTRLCGFYAAFSSNLGHVIPCAFVCIER
jgi:hypothetical protein